MSVLKIISDTNCSVRCDFQEVGNIQVGELFKLQLKKGCYILEFLVENIVICSMDYTIETNDEEPLLRLNIKEQAEKIMERQYGFVFSEDGRTIIDCNTSFEGELIVPEGVEHIAKLAFDSCKASSIRIPNSVTSIGEGAFFDCSGLTSITIPDSVTSIGDNAFYGCSSLTSITIPNSVTRIEKCAFRGCSSLTSVTIPNSVTRIESCAFCDCSGLTSVTIPNSVTSIESAAFYECSGLTSVTIEEGVTSIADEAFSKCTDLTSVTIPNSVTSIGNEAFYECSGLTSVTIPNSVTSIGKRAFSDCSSLTSITIPNSVTSIGDGAFSGCSGLTSITIPNSVTRIGDYAFGSCTGLTSITVEERNPIYDSRNNCNAIIEKESSVLILGCKNTIIPNSVTSIGDGAFSKCTGLTSVTISNSVTSIGNHAFSGCSGLTSITIPNSVTSIGNYAFSGCESLTTIVVEKGNTKYDSRNKCNAIIETSSNTLIVGCKNTTIPNSVTSIGNYAFFVRGFLTSVTIPNSVTSIGNYAFSGCSLISITFPDSVTSIGYSVFAVCNNLKEIIIPKGTRAKFEEMLPHEKNKLVEQEQMAKRGTKDRFLFFDTETTGIPNNYKAPSSDTLNWPRLVQLAWILTDEEGNKIHTGNLIIKPDGFIIPADATNVHGITTQRANEEGVSLAEVIEQFKADLDMATYIVGHNIEFDKKIVGAEMIRLGMKDELEKKKSYCTMQSSIDFCKIPGKYGYKYPKLQELYRKLFGKDFEDAHNAMSDIEATEKCFWELKKRKLI